MRKLIFVVSALTFCSILGWSADWLTGGYDSQRTHWQKDEKSSVPSTAKNMKLLWKIQLDTKPRVMSNLFTTLVADRVTTKYGPKQIALVAGVTDDLFAIDAEKGTILWSKHYQTRLRRSGPLGQAPFSAPADRRPPRRSTKSRPASTRSTRSPGWMPAPDQPGGRRRHRAADQVRSAERQDSGRSISTRA